MPRATHDSRHRTVLGGIAGGLLGMSAGKSTPINASAGMLPYRSGSSRARCAAAWTCRNIRHAP